MKSLKFITFALSMMLILGYSTPSSAMRTERVILYSSSDVIAFCARVKCISIVETRDNGEEFWVIYEVADPQSPVPGRGEIVG